VVLPDEATPQISVRQPLGILAERWSRHDTPEETVSGMEADQIVSAPGMRCSNAFSIWTRRSAAVLTISPFTMCSLFIHFRVYDSYRKRNGCQEPAAYGEE